ncbi:gluconate 5-dehydrogenase [Anaeromyces robustus]|uniref:Gluconate 5-dehydrogenase n=1 Tax=Anaeromyces robustus TaxID=1754192 RepID=A0A1Y1WZY2_9FUNG|nr:gluconate 5-dehydrogenase [Anaeromyces robustus]|eukprot:ORX78746.1 gluconate 5-dehydrogenase [Anaeromyces robustus]
MGVRLQGFNVFITGGSCGMGYEMAKELLSRGATVVISARGVEKLNKAYEKLKSEGYDVYSIPLDVTNEESVNNAVTWYKEHFDHLDMLVNNAGIGNNAPGMISIKDNKHFYDIPVSTFKSIVETNFNGIFLVSRAFVPIMIEKGKGRIVNVSTSASTMTRKGMIPYGPSKAAMEAMSTILSEELKEFEITVNIICPGGPTDTDMTTEEMKTFFNENDIPILKSNILNKTILFLASPNADGLTGEKIIGKEFNEWLKNRNISFEC